MYSASVTKQYTQMYVRTCSYTKIYFTRWPAPGLQPSPSMARPMVRLLYIFFPMMTPYRHQTQPTSYTGTTGVCVQNFAAYVALIRSLSQTQLSYI